MEFPDERFIFNLTRQRFFFSFFFFLIFNILFTSDPPETDFTDDERSTGNKYGESVYAEPRVMNNALFAFKVPISTSPLRYTLYLGTLST